MKKIFLSLVFIFIVGAIFAQVNYVTQGNIGVGTAAPAARLDVNGDIKLQYGFAVNRIDSVGRFADDTTIVSSNGLYNLKVVIDDSLADHWTAITNISGNKFFADSIVIYEATGDSFKIKITSSDSYINWDDGILYLYTNETNAKTHLYLQGNGSGAAGITLKDGSGAYITELEQDDGIFNLQPLTSGAAIVINDDSEDNKRFRVESDNEQYAINVYDDSISLFNNDFTAKFNVNGTSYFSDILTANTGIVTKGITSNNTLGTLNEAFGYEAGNTSMTGDYNTMLGQSAGYSITDGDYNTIIGAGSGNELTTGDDNVFVGYSSGTSAIGGIDNVCVGNYAGGHITEGDGNIFIGKLAGFSNVTGVENTFIGREAGFNELGSNKLYIENSIADSTEALIYGDFTSDYVRINTKLGINVTNPTPVFQANDNGLLVGWTANTDATGAFVNGTDHSIVEIAAPQDKSTGIYFSDTNGYQGAIIYNNATKDMDFYTKKIQAMTIDSNQYVGIGYTNPNSRLAVNGNVGIGYTNAENGLAVNGNIGIGTTSPTNKFSLINSTVTSDSNIVMTAAGRLGIGTTNPGSRFTVCNSKTGEDSNFYITKKGWVAMGSYTPLADLHIYGDNSKTSRIRLGTVRNSVTAIDNIMSGLELMTHTTAVNNYYSSALKFMTTDGSHTTTNPSFTAGIYARATETYDADDKKGTALYFGVTANSAGVTTLPTTAMVIDQSGYVGIGTTQPTQALQVAGNIQTQGFYTNLTKVDSSNYTILSSDYFIHFVKAMLVGNDTIFLPEVTATNKGCQLIIMSTSAPANGSTVYISAYAGQNIYETTSVSPIVSAGASTNIGYRLISNGSNGWVKW